MGDIHRCAFEHNGERCPFPGTTAAIHGTNWHCRWHKDACNRGHGREQDEFWLQHVVTSEKQAKTLELWYGPPFRVEHLIAAADGQRRPGEGVTEYRARVLREAGLGPLGLESSTRSPGADDDRGEEAA